jgi:CubicO group peptidase (beta-lactamase class C family)
LTQTQVSAEKSAQVDALFSNWPRGEAPGAAVAVVRDGRVLHLKGYGLANLETGAHVNARTPFRLASLTKQFTAVSVMLLRERGALDYADPASKFLPEFSTRARGVTVRHLLQHTSGLADYETQLLEADAIDVDYPRSSRLGASRYEPSTRDVVELVCARPLRFAPGDEWEYSNSGYAALALIVEKISDRPFARFLEEQFFRPLGMTDSRLYETARPNVEGSALGYTREGAGFRDVDYTPMNAVYGQDGIYSTAEDMVSWCRALGDGTLLNEASLREAFTSGVLNVGAKTGYGLGWFVGNTLGLRCVSHTGSWGGHRHVIAHYPEQRLTTLVLSNFDEFDDVARSAAASRLATIYLSDEMTFRPPVSLAPGVPRRYEGRYELGGGEHFDVKLEGDALHVSPRGLFPVRLVPESEVKFFVEGAEGDTYFFRCDGEGRVWGVTRHLSLFGHCSDAYMTALKLT